MGAIAAVFDRKGANAAFLVLTMLEELKHRGTKTPRIAMSHSILNAKSLGKLKNGKKRSKTAVGTNTTEPFLGDNYAWTFEGRIFPLSHTSILNQTIGKLKQQETKITARILKKLNGSYAFTVAFPHKVLVGRDTTGTYPLYYGENKSFCAVASERKALWKIGISNVHSFPPGNTAIIDQAGFTFDPVAALRPLPQAKIRMADATKHLRNLLEESTRERVSNEERVAVAFSGGLDSSIMAVLAKLSGVSVNLISVGLEGESENERVKEAAETLGLPLTSQTYTVADVENVLPKVLWLIEESNIMKIGVAIPFFWTAGVSSKLGFRVLLAGQGADELFGGYHRYLTEYARDGPEKVEETLFDDTAMSHETNFQRDESVCAYHKVELRLPFADTRVVRFALSLPLSLKIDSFKDELRKRVLRQVARDLGIPASIADKPKKAVQFATGVDKAVKKLAWRKGLKPGSYIEKLFRGIYPTVEGRKK